MTDVFTHLWQCGLFNDNGLTKFLNAQAQLQQILAVELAHTKALQATGAISSETAAPVIALLQDPALDMDRLQSGTAIDGVPIPEIVRQLRSQLPEQHHCALHQGLTSQDVIDTALALSLKPILDQLSEGIAKVQMALADLTALCGNKPLLGRTRMQAAIPIKVADRIDTWAMPLAGHADRLRSMRPNLEILSLGGPVGARPTDDIARHMADALNLTLAVKAPHAMRGDLADLAGWLSRVTGSLGKIGQDITIMAQQGIDEISLAGGGSSSAMPHKTNPVRAELLVTLAHFNAIQLPGMHHALIHEQERSGIMWALEWMLLPPMMQATGTALHAAHTLIKDIKDIGNSTTTPERA